MLPIVKFEAKDKAEFFNTLRQRVNDYFETHKIARTGNSTMVIKTLAMFAIYFVPYALIMSNSLSLWAMWIMAAIMGLGAAGIGFSVMHDANHGAYTRNKTLNEILGLSINIVGGSSFTWKIQHNFLHHTYTNIYELDEDIADKPILRLSPHGKLLKIHRYQHIYAVFLYTLATVGWVTKKDFAQLIKYNKEGLTKKLGFNPSKELVILIVSKLIYFGYIIVLPLLLLDITFWQWLLGFFTLHAVLGLVMTMVFQLAHVVEGPTHHEPTFTGKMDNTWAIHQLETTADFGRNSKLLGWYIGGLNFQVEHHLFPTICHIHYKDISEIVKKTAAEFGLPYHDQKSFFSAFRSHLRVLKAFGRNEMLTA